VKELIAIKKLMPLKLLMQSRHISSKIQYKPQITELYSFNEQVFTFWLQHYPKFCLTLLFYMIFSASAI